MEIINEISIIDYEMKVITMITASHPFTIHQFTLHRFKIHQFQITKPAVTKSHSSGSSQLRASYSSH